MLHLFNDPTYQTGRDQVGNLSDMFAKLEVASGRSTHNSIYSATVPYPDLPRLAANSTGKEIMSK